MKKKLLCLSLFFLVLSLTGCVKYNATMDIKKDKSMDFLIIYAVDTSIFGEKDILDVEQKNDLTKNGFTVSDYLDGNMKGVKLNKSIKNIDSVSSTSSVDYSLSGIMDSTSDNIFTVKKGFLKNTYTAKFNFDASDSNINNGLNTTDDNAVVVDDSTDYIAVNDTNTTGAGAAIIDDSTVESEIDIDSEIDLSDEMPDFSNALASSMDLSFNVKLPYSAISNNATSVSDGNKSLTWSLASDSVNSIEFSFELYNLTNILIAGGGALLLVILLIIFISVISKKKKNKKETVVPDTTVAVPDLTDADAIFKPFSEQDFNKQLMTDNSQNVSSEGVVNAESTSVVQNLVPEAVLPPVQPTEPVSVVQNLVPEAGLPPVAPTVETPVQTSVSEPNDIFNSKFEFITDVPSANVEAPQQNVASTVPAQPVVQENSNSNVFEQPVIQEVPVQPVPVAPVQSVPEVPVQPTPVQSVPEVPVSNVVPPVQGEPETVDVVEDPFNGESI